jgi:hypothetical protein
VSVDTHYRFAELLACDVVVFQQSASTEMLECIRGLNNRGTLTVYELDDDYWSLRPSNPVYAEWNAGDKLSLMRECMRACALVTTTTTALADRLRARGAKNVAVLPNCLPPYGWSAPKPEADHLVIGWAGGTSHWADVALLSGVLENVLGDHENVQVQLCGMDRWPFAPDWHIEGRMKAVLPVPVSEYQNILKPFDIALAPLVDNDFNRSKSDLKYLEYSAAGAAVIASPVGPYKDLPCPKAKNAKGWLKAINRFISDEDARCEAAQTGQRIAEARTIGKHIHLWERAYSAPLAKTG